MTAGIAGRLGSYLSGIKWEKEEYLKKISNAKLKIIPLGGLELIGMNITAFETENSIIVMGDVYPGACIISKKDIIVLGGLYGQAYAGGNGLDNHFVVALEMSPEKLKIGEFKYKTSEKQSKWSIKPKVQPKIAYVKDGRVVMDAITKELLNALPV